MPSASRTPRPGSPAGVYNTLQKLVMATAALWVVVVALGAGALIAGKKGLDQIRRDEKLAIRALCFQRGTLDHQIKQTKSFLKTHPHGIPGISRALFEQGIHQDEKARAALADIHC